MWRAALVMLLAVPLPAPFGDAEASALSVSEDGAAVLDVSVEVSGSPAAVLVRGVGPVDELPPVALSPRGDGTYGGIVELNTTTGVLLAFEYIPAGGGAATLTDLYTLVELGVDPAVLIGVTPAPPKESPPEAVPTGPDDTDDARWGWFALATGAAGLALLLVWLWMGRGQALDDVSDNENRASSVESRDADPSSEPTADS